MLSGNAEDRVGIIFGFSLYIAFLLVILVTYFRSECDELSGLRLLEDDEVCHCQHWKGMSVLVNFQNKTSII